MLSGVAIEKAQQIQPGEIEVKKRRFRHGKWIGIAISLVFLYLAFRGLDWRNLWSALKEVNLLVLSGGVCIYLISYIFRGLRWHLMLRSVKSISVRDMTRFVIMGFMCNNLLPARLGEFARALIIANKERISARASFASVVLERFFDGLTIVLLLLVLMIQQPFPPWVRQMGLFAAALFLIGFVFLIILGHKGEKWIRVIQNRFPGVIIGKAAGFMLKFIDGLEMLKDKKQVFAVFMLSMLIWAIESINYLVVMRSLGIGLGTGAAAFTLVVANLGIMIPSSPGNVGTMHYFLIRGLSMYGVGKDLSLAYALVLHAAIYLPITILGILFLSQMGLSLKSIKITGRSTESLD